MGWHGLAWVGQDPGTTFEEIRSSAGREVPIAEGNDVLQCIVFQPCEKPARNRVTDQLQWGFSFNKIISP